MTPVLSGDLPLLTWPDVARDGLVLVPVGSLEQHGPHLPLNTDSVIAEAVVRRTQDRLEAAGLRSVAAPVVAYGASGEHQSFPGTVSIGSDVLRLVLVELVRSMCTWAARAVLVNGHGGNLSAVRGATTQLRAEGHDVAWVPCAPHGADAHAGRAETSLLLHLDLDLVRLDRAAAGDTRPIDQLLPFLREVGVADVSPNGVLGDPAGARADEGRILLAAMVDETADLVLSGTADHGGRLRPPAKSGVGGLA